MAPDPEREVPSDLVAPFGGESCCGGEIWLAPLLQVVLASQGVAPLVAECCGQRFRPRDLGQIAFVSRAEWDAAPEDAPPKPYFLDSAYLVPLGRA